MFPSKSVLTWLSILLILGRIPARADAQAGPLAPAEWASVREAYDAGQRAVQPLPGGAGYVAKQKAQAWQTTFDGKGFLTKPQRGDWTWGLNLKSVGELPMPDSAALSAQDSRLDCRWTQEVTEWFENEPAGIHQGWTIVRRPQGTSSEIGPLSLRFAITGNLLPTVSQDGTEVAFHDPQGTPALTFAGLKAWDSTGKAIATRFTLPKHGGTLEITVDDTDAVYPLTIDPWAQNAYLKASNTDANDYFGSAVAISGNTVVVGAPIEASATGGVNGNEINNSAPYSGAAYVFVRNPLTGRWSQQAYLKASNSEAGDTFGNSVAIDGDIIVVGAFFEKGGLFGVEADNSMREAGAAYVFVRSTNGQWAQQAYLKSSTPHQYAEFGYEVSISGLTVVVGAYQESSSSRGVDGIENGSGADYSGAAYVFMRNAGGIWRQQAFLKASNADADDRFGTSVAISGNTIVVGAYAEDGGVGGINQQMDNNSASASGAAYVFVRNSAGSWSQQAYLKASKPEFRDFFGVSAAISGDTVVVGASGDDGNGTGVTGNQSDNTSPDSGAAYVFSRSGNGVWEQQAYLKAETVSMQLDFGRSVACSGDLVAIGQPTNNGLTGKCFLFGRSNSGSWSFLQRLAASPGYTYDGFGQSVAISADIVVVGMPNDASSSKGMNGDPFNEAAINSGAVRIFTIPPSFQMRGIVNTSGRQIQNPNPGFPLQFYYTSFLYWSGDPNLTTGWQINYSYDLKTFPSILAADYYPAEPPSGAANTGVIEESPGYYSYELKFNWPAHRSAFFRVAR